jgi:hypothetical protein
MAGVINLINSDNLVKTSAADAVTRKDVDLHRSLNQPYQSKLDIAFRLHNLCQT